MGWLRKVFGGGEEAAAPSGPVTLDTEARTEQIKALEGVLDRLVALMSDNAERMANPGWREKVGEYRRLSGECYRLRSAGFTREQLLDLAFEIRPVFTGSLPDDVEAVRPVQEELMATAEALREVLPSERASQ